MDNTVLELPWEYIEDTYSGQGCIYTLSTDVEYTPVALLDANGKAYKQQEKPKMGFL